MNSRYSANVRNAGAKKVLEGATLKVVAREIDCSPDAVEGWLLGYLEAMPGFSREEYWEYHGQPNIGRVTAARLYYQDLMGATA